MTETVEKKVQRIQTIAIAAAALLSILSAGLVLLNLPVPRNTSIVMALALIVNALLLAWTVRRLKR